MKRVIIFLSFLVISALAYPAEEYPEQEDTEEDDETVPDEVAFVTFAQKFEKKYADAKEKKNRLGIFAKNRKKINDHNKLFKKKKISYKLKMNRLGDLTSEEYCMSYKGLIRDSPPNNTLTVRTSRAKRDTPISFDYRAKNVITGIQNQGKCGSCYSFSAVAAIESHLALAGGGLYKLSEQQIVDCTYNKGNAGCKGGRPQIVYNYVKNIGGITSAKSYPYTSGPTLQPGTCRYNPSMASKAKVTDSINVAPSEGNLQAALLNYGPIAVNIDAHSDSFRFYSSGIYNNPSCLQGYYDLDHSVLLIGYGVNNASVEFWTIKNSWGTTWGMQGYVKMSRNQNNQCGIATDGSFPAVSVQ